MSKKILVIGILTYYIFSSFAYGKDTIMVSIPPQKYFLQQLAEDKFTIKVMMEDNLRPSIYKPTAAQYVWAESAVAYFKIGLFDEKKWISKITERNKKMQSFDTTLNIKKDPTDPYIWLDPKLVRLQAKNMFNALVKIDKSNKDFYRKNYFKFVNKVSRLDFQLRTIFKKSKHNHFIVFRPEWSYFAKRYKLKQLEIVADPLSTQDENIRTILIQASRFSSNLLFIPKYYFPKETLGKINRNSQVFTVPITPLEYDWVNNLLNMAKIIAYQPR